MVLVEPSDVGLESARTAAGRLAILRDDCVRLDATPLATIYARNGFVDEYPLSRMTATVDAAEFPLPRPALVDAANRTCEVFLHDR